MTEEENSNSNIAEEESIRMEKSMDGEFWMERAAYFYSVSVATVLQVWLKPSALKCTRPREKRENE